MVPRATCPIHVASHAVRDTHAVPQSRIFYYRNNRNYPSIFQVDHVLKIEKNHDSLDLNNENEFVKSHRLDGRYPDETHESGRICKRMLVVVITKDVTDKKNVISRSMDNHNGNA